MPIKRSKGDIYVGKPAPTWFVSYGDLMTQILVFFVMLFALGAAMSQSQLEEIRDRIHNYSIDNNIQDYIGLKIDERGLTVSLSDRLMFASGRAVIQSDDARRHIGGIGGILMEYPNYVKIEGHTDDRPIRTAEFPSNWELSAARATNLTRYLIEQQDFPPPRLSSSGYGEYHPVDTNDTQEGRAGNRRVDLVVKRLTLDQQRQDREKSDLAGKEFQSVN